MLTACGILVFGAAREHENRMRGDAEKRSVITAGIETTHVEVPMVLGTISMSASTSSRLRRANSRISRSSCR